MIAGLPADKISPAEVVTATFAALASGQEEVYPGGPPATEVCTCFLQRSQGIGTAASKLNVVDSVMMVFIMMVFFVDRLASKRWRSKNAQLEDQSASEARRPSPCARLRGE